MYRVYLTACWATRRAPGHTSGDDDNIAPTQRISQAVLIEALQCDIKNASHMSTRQCVVTGSACAGLCNTRAPTFTCALVLMWLTSAPTPGVPAISYRDSCDTCWFICERACTAREQHLGVDRLARPTRKAHATASITAGHLHEHGQGLADASRSAQHRDLAADAGASRAGHLAGELRCQELQSAGRHLA